MVFFYTDMDIKNINIKNDTLVRTKFGVHCTDLVNCSRTLLCAQWRSQGGGKGLGPQSSMLSCVYMHSIRYCFQFYNFKCTLIYLIIVKNLYVYIVKINSMKNKIQM